MGIYIKGMEMPEGYTDVRIYADGRVVSQSIRAFGEIIATAVPVPPHGDLIDRDELEYHADNVRDPMGRTEKTVMWKKIEAAPTIIPADPTEEDDKNDF